MFIYIQRDADIFETKETFCDPLKSKHAIKLMDFIASSLWQCDSLGFKQERVDNQDIYLK